VWLASYTFRAGGKRRAPVPEDNTGSAPTHSNPAPVQSSGATGTCE
jgi:hypothetical protein